MLKHNFVVVAPTEFSKFSFKDVLQDPGVHFYSSYNQNSNNFLLKKIIRLNFSKKINKYIRNPFSVIVNPKLFDLSFQENKKICMVFVGAAWYLFNSTYIKYLRKHYPEIKLVLYMQDLVQANKNICIDNTKQIFDLMISYDESDASKHKMVYYPTPYPNFIVNDDDSLEESDVYFCGKAKSFARYKNILDVYRKCIDLGLKADFYVSELPTEKMEKISGIKYDVPLTYEQNLQHVKKTKCILEVMQDGAVGYTPRLWESIIYDKHLLTNNESLKSSKYTSEYVHYLQDGLIDVKDWINQTAVYLKKEKDALSSMNFLKFIDDAIECM